MKTKLHLLLFALTLSSITFLSSCVSKGKFLAAQNHVQKLQSDSTDTHYALNSCNTALNDCNTQVQGLKGNKSSLESQLSALQYTAGNLKDSATRSKLTIEEQAKRLAALQNLIQSQKDVMNRLRKSIADALVNFKPEELSVYIKDGNVYVSLEEKLLFKSGSAVVDPRGKEALGKLAMVLNSTSDITVQIEGHTDTIPIHNSAFEDNWALSTARATSIVRILTKSYDVDARRIIASGRGEFHPIRTNDTPEGRGSNRRTEIILSPNLSELYKLLAQ